MSILYCCRRKRSRFLLLSAIKTDNEIFIFLQRKCLKQSVLLHGHFRYVLQTLRPITGWNISFIFITPNHLFWTYLSVVYKVSVIYTLFFSVSSVAKFNRSLYSVRAANWRKANDVPCDRKVRYNLKVGLQDRRCCMEVKRGFKKIKRMLPKCGGLGSSYVDYLKIFYYGELPQPFGLNTAEEDEVGTLTSGSEHVKRTKS